MRFFTKLVIMAVLLLGMMSVKELLAQKQMLSSEMIRLHVVADSDSQEDQSIKLQVKDAVLEYIQKSLPRDLDVKQAKSYLLDNLENIEQIANEVLANQGSTDSAKVTLEKEEFPVRYYDTFSLPSGIYESLRIKIGAAKGENWWCVVFPSLCIGAASEDFNDAATGAGFSDALTLTLSGDEDYEISFFFLDCLGKLENFFHFG